MLVPLQDTRREWATLVMFNTRTLDKEVTKIHADQDVPPPLHSPLHRIPPLPILPPCSRAFSTHLELPVDSAVDDGQLV